MSIVHILAGINIQKIATASYERKLSVLHSTLLEQEKTAGTTSSAFFGRRSMQSNPEDGPVAKKLHAFKGMGDKIRDVKAGIQQRLNSKNKVDMGLKERANRVNAPIAATRAVHKQHGKNAKILNEASFHLQKGNTEHKSVQKAQDLLGKHIIKGDGAAERLRGMASSIRKGDLSGEHGKAYMQAKKDEATKKKVIGYGVAGASTLATMYAANKMKNTAGRVVGGVAQQAQQAQRMPVQQPVAPPPPQMFHPY